MFELHLGDCLTVMAGMPDKSVGVTITDPPYSEHVHSKVRATSSLGDMDRYASSAVRHRKFGFTHITTTQMNATAAELARLTKRWVLVFCNVELTHEWRLALEQHGLEYVRTGAWVKRNSPPQFSGDRPAVGFEAVVIAHPPGRKHWHGGGRHGLWEHNIVLNRGGKTPRLHTTQKPLSLMTELVTLFSDPGETVFDPYSGSSTTGHACLLTGRRFVGVEVDPAYHAASLRRLKAVQAQPTFGALESAAQPAPLFAPAEETHAR